MYRCKVKAYEGPEAYIFVSYAHRDSDIVLPILDALSDMGYRIWYDDGIAPGSEWPEYIATHLNNCQVVLAFVSANSIESSNCRREVTFALSKNKTFLGVILEDTQMSAGMELQLSAQQCVLRYSYRNPETGDIDDDQFLSKLAAAEELQSCRALSQDAIEEAIRREQEEAAAAQAKLDALKKAREEKLAAEEAVREMERLEQAAQEEKDNSAGDMQDQENSTTKKPEKKRDKKSSGEKAGKKRKSADNSKKKKLSLKAVLIGIPLIVILLFAGLVLHIMPDSGKSNLVKGDASGSGQSSSPVINAQKDTTYLNFVDLTVTQKLVGQMNKYSKLKTVSFENCSFEDVDFGKVASSANWRYVSFINCEQLPALDVLYQEKLTELTIQNCKLKTEDIRLSDLKCQTLKLSDNPDFTSIEGLSESVHDLDISGTGVQDLTPIVNCEKFTSLVLNGCIQIKDFNPLSQVEIQELHARNCGITGISDSFKKLDMTIVDLRENEISDSSFLNNLTRLKALDMTGNPITSLDCAAKSASSLQVLNVSETQLDSEFLISLAGCTQLQELRIREIATDNLDFVKDMSQLELLSASECGITNIDGLAGKEALTYLYLGNNQITSTASLEGLQQDRYRYFDLRNNAITKCRIPAKLSVLLLEGNPKEVITTIPDSVKISLLVLDYDPLLLNPDECPVALKKGSEVIRVIVLDVPEDQKLNLKDSLEMALVISTTERLEACYSETGGRLNSIYDWDL